MIRVERASKTFIMHLRGGARIAALRDVSLSVAPGECVVLRGPSGAGKSTLLKMIYGAYRCDSGRLVVRDGAEDVDVAAAAPRRILALRRRALAYVSQFLCVIPRIPTLEIVAAEARAYGMAAEAAKARAASLLAGLNLPEPLWALPPATFSGGEQQRVNIARGLVAGHPILLLDEPTASLDAANRAAVVELMNAKKSEGAAILGVFHDEDVRDRIADRLVDIAPVA
ncbi:MAG TPA: phosphonate C-P lyase system protein PhnL [Roseiarcus sp.]|nr:phosphonate C-P lyase system protein PhnL [Roseiarcus sp.]